MNQVKWGVLGYAHIASTEVLPAIMEATNACPYAIASRNVDKLYEADRSFGFRKGYNSYEALLADPQVDAVYIPLPNALHKEWTLKAIAAGKHVLCEKPLAQTPEDCQEMIAAAKAKKVLLTEAFMYRFANRVAILRELIRNGEIGEVRSIYASQRFVLSDAGNVRVNQGLGGGSLWDVGCYPVNLIGMILEQEPTDVCAFKQEFQGVDSALCAILRYPGGVLCAINSGFDAQSGHLAEIMGTKGSLVVPNTFGDHDDPIQLVHDGSTTLIPVPACHRYTMEIEAFSNAVLRGSPLPYDTSEAIRNTRVINQILEVAK